jgi:antitoxin component of RelBE/YafQ-DinJ toxin-antitoxin module
VPKKLGPDDPGAGRAIALRLNDSYLADVALIQDRFGLSRSDAIRAAIQRFAEELAA